MLGEMGRKKEKQHNIGSNKISTSGGKEREMSIIYDWECQTCQIVMELMGTPVEQTKDCPICGGVMIKVITKVPLQTYRDPNKRLWGTSHLSSSLKFQEKAKKKGGKK